MLVFFFFFKKKTAYEIGARLVGSEMCIRDRIDARHHGQSFKKSRHISGTSVRRCNKSVDDRAQHIGTGQCRPVSYTHLTLPTKRIVEISVGAAVLKKKKTKA